METKLDWLNKHKYTIIFLLSIVFAVYIFMNPAARNIISNLENYGYVGAFITGMFYTFSVSSPISTAVILLMAKNLNPILVALLGGLGAMFFDLIIFDYVKIDMLPELKLIRKELRIPKIHLEKHGLMNKFLPYIAGFVIASPLPDEIGALILGSIKYETKKFMVISFVCNSLGIFVLSLISKLIA